MLSSGIAGQTCCAYPTLGEGGVATHVRNMGDGEHGHRVGKGIRGVGKG